MLEQIHSPADLKGLSTEELTDLAQEIREFVVAAFGALQLKLKFEGKGRKEIARRTDTGAVVLPVDPKFYRPLDSVRLVGDASLAKRVLKWKPTITGADVARAMAKADASALRADEI